MTDPGPKCTTDPPITWPIALDAHRQIETLMSRGVASEEAVDIIVCGMLR